MSSPAPKDMLQAALVHFKTDSLVEAGRLAAAFADLHPDVADAHNLLGAIALREGRNDAAAASFERALALEPARTDARLNLARLQSAMGQPAEAAANFEAVADSAAQSPGALFDWAQVLRRLGQPEAAEQKVRQSLALSPAIAVRLELGSVLLAAGKTEEAEAIFSAIADTAEPSAAGFAEALLNLSVIRDTQGRQDEMLPLQERALAAAPDNLNVQYHRALTLLGQGRLAEGWAAYASRFRRPGSKTLFGKLSLPLWEGEPLAGKGLLVWTEQGPGDEILLAGMLPDLLAQGARVTLICFQRVAALFARSFPAIEILTREDIGAGRPFPITAKWQASVSHLGAVLRPSLDHFPRHSGYLRADLRRTQELRARYKAERPGPLVGIAWRSANAEAGREKSTALSQWKPILATPHVRFVSLQYGDHGSEIAQARAGGANLVTDPTIDALRDLDGLAAQVAAMDLVISVSSTVVHLAGGLNRPVWTLIPAATGRIWYWFLDRQDSPWYPSMRLFRQANAGDWGPVMSSVADQLQQWL